MVYHSLDVGIEFSLYLHHQIRIHLILDFHANCGSGSMQLRICVRPSSADRADKKSYEGRVKQCHFEIWQSLADVNPDSTPLMLLEMEVGSFVKEGDGKKCGSLQGNVRCWYCEQLARCNVE